MKKNSHKFTFFFCLAIFVILAGIFFDKILHFDEITKYSRDFGVEKSLVISLIWEESKFKKTAISSAKALGLMQLMPQTAAHISKNLKIQNFNEMLLLDSDINIRLGTYYLKFLLDRYDDDLILSLASYNAGIGVVDTWISEIKLQDRKSEIADIKYKSTQVFVKKVLRNYKFLKRLGI